MTNRLNGKLSDAIAELRIRFDDPQHARIVLDATDCRLIANELVRFEIAAEEMWREIRDLYRRGKEIVDENRDLRAEKGRLERENQALQRQLLGKGAEILSFRPRHRPVAASTNPGGDAA